MSEFPNEQLAKGLRRMMRVHAPAEVESVSKFQSRDGEFANLVFRNEDEYNAIIEWLTEPTDNFRVHLAYAGETKTRVGVAYVAIIEQEN